MFCAAAAPRQWRSPRRGARRAGEYTPLQLSIKLVICNTSVQIQLSCASSMISVCDYTTYFKPDILSYQIMFTMVSPLLNPVVTSSCVAFRISDYLLANQKSLLPPGFVKKVMVDPIDNFLTYSRADRLPLPLCLPRRTVFPR